MFEALPLFTCGARDFRVWSQASRILGIVALWPQFETDFAPLPQSTKNQPKPPTLGRRGLSCNAGYKSAPETEYKALSVDNVNSNSFCKPSIGTGVSANWFPNRPVEVGEHLTLRAVRVSRWRRSVFLGLDVLSHCMPLSRV